MKHSLTLFLFLLASLCMKAQTVVVLELPDPCPTQVEENTNEKSSLSIAPNPFSDELVLQINETEPVTSIDITIADMKGMALLREQHVVDGPFRQLKLNLGHLSSGLYLLSVNTDYSVFVKKIIKK